MTRPALWLFGDVPHVKGGHYRHRQARRAAVRRVMALDARWVATFRRRMWWDTVGDVGLNFTRRLLSKTIERAAGRPPLKGRNR